MGHKRRLAKYSMRHVDGRTGKQYERLLRKRLRVWYIYKSTTKSMMPKPADIVRQKPPLSPGHTICAAYTEQYLYK